jgi:hypothetical protein
LLLLPVSVILAVLYGLFMLLQSIINMNSYLMIFIFGALYCFLFFLLIWHSCLNDYERNLFNTLFHRIIILMRHGK